VKWVVANELVTGKDNGLLDPAGNVTRAEVIAILKRFAENVTK
jgi:hypothetical protein